MTRLRTRAGVRVKQHDVTDCGAACLASVAAHYGLRMPIARIRQLATTDSRGTNILGLVSAATELGMSAKGVKATLEALPKVSLPAIAHTRLPNGTQHYVVLYRLSKGRVAVMDPADGEVRRIPVDAFAAIWTGVLVLLAPGESFRGGDSTVSAAARLLGLLQPHRSVLVQTLVGAVVYTILGLSTAVFVQKLVDHVLVYGNRNLLNLLGLLMVGVLLLQFFIGTMKDLITLRTGQRIDASIILGYYQHLLTLPQQFFDTMRAGEIISRVNDAVKIRAFINDVAVGLAVNVLVVIFSFLLMFVYSAKLGLVMLTMIPVYGTVYWIANRVNKSTQRRLMESAADVESQLVESVGAVATIKRFGLEGLARIKTEIRLVRLLRNVYRSGLTALHSRNVSESAARVFTLVVLWVGGFLVIEQALTPGELMSCYALVGYLTAPVASLVGANRTLQDALIAADRLFEIMALESEPAGGGALLGPDAVGDITFENVSFRYGSRAKIFDGLDLVVPRGKVTAVIGGSGSGKTTLISLLHSIYPHSGGSIRIGGRDIRHFSTESLRRTIGVVPQEVHLFAGTVLENIAVGEYEPNMAKILDISDLLGITSFVQDLPGGFQSYLGDNGATLSGGQRQRLAIARALYRDPEVLILDEATSSLDPTAEEQVKSVLQRLRAAGKTILLIAHRLSSVVDADKIVLLEGGRVVAEGTHTELMRVDGPYVEFWRARV